MKKYSIKSNRFSHTILFCLSKIKTRKIINKDINFLDTRIESEYDKVDFDSMNEDAMLLDTREGPEYDKMDIIPLDTPVKPEYDKRDASHKLLLKLDTREGPEYDKMDIIPLDTPVKPEYDIGRAQKSKDDTERVLKTEYNKRKNKAKNDNIVSSSPLPSDNTSSSLSCPYLIRASRKHECQIESGRILHPVTLGRTKHFPNPVTLGRGTDYSPSVTLGRTKHFPNPVTLGRGIDYFPSVTLGRTKHFPNPVTLGRGTDYSPSVTLGRSETKTRGSRNEMKHCFSGYSGRSTNMTNGNNALRMISQSGRSMVEMLGVLAVIGVLSIGGIVGYSYAMDKYRANVTINDVNLRAVDLMAQIANGSENPNLSEWSETGTAGYPISVSTDYAPSQYFIKVELVPQTVCEIIADTFPENEVEIWIDNDDKECKEINTMEFGYNGFIKQGCSTSAECRGDTPVCNPDTGLCEPYPDDEACGGCPVEKPYCDSVAGVCGDCKYDSDCTHLGKNYLCLHHESDTTRLSTYKSGYNTCRAYGTGSSFKAGGIEWIQIYSGNHPSYYDAEKVCAHLNKRLPSVHELISNFEGYIGDGFELTPLGEAVAEKYNSNIATNTSAFSYNHLYFIVSLDTGWVSHDLSHYPHPTLCRDK